MGTVESIQTWLNSGEESLLWLMLGIIALSYLLEDLAIVSAAGVSDSRSHPTAICSTCHFHRYRNR